jgi:hypothetical protein
MPGTGQIGCLSDFRSARKWVPQVSIFIGAPSDRGPNEQVFVRGEEGQVFVAGVV